MIKEGSTLSRVGTGIAIACLLTVLGFGLKVYGNQDQQFTKDDARAAQSEAFLYNESVYVHKDVSAAQFSAIKEQLDRMERKIDRLEAEK